MLRVLCCEYLCSAHKSLKLPKTERFFMIYDVRYTIRKRFIVSNKIHHDYSLRFRYRYDQNDQCDRIWIFKCRITVRLDYLLSVSSTLNLFLHSRVFLSVFRIHVLDIQYDGAGRGRFGDVYSSKSDSVVLWFGYGILDHDNRIHIETIHRFSVKTETCLSTSFSILSLLFRTSCNSDRVSFLDRFVRTERWMVLVEKRFCRSILALHAILFATLDVHGVQRESRIRYAISYRTSS